MKALITGVTSGIGYEFSFLLAKKGYDLILVARKENILKEMKEQIEKEYNIEVEYILCDFTDMKRVNEVAKEIKDMDIDIFINNAGFDISGEFANVEYSNIQNMIDVNVITMTKLLYVVLQNMKDKKKGHVLNLASMASIVPMIYSGVYTGTKAYNKLLTEAIHFEYAPYNVCVSVLCPGPTSTNFAKTAAMEDKKVFKSGVMSPKKVAEYGYKKLMKNKMLIIPGFSNKMTSFASRFVPRRLLVLIAKEYLK